jgi:hypothetical protein
MCASKEYLETTMHSTSEMATTVSAAASSPSSPSAGYSARSPKYSPDL